MKQNQVHNRTYLKDRRKELRNNLTPAEAVLWKMLQSRALKGRKFRRQHSIENYIVDFYCPAEKLIIELDGEVHNDPIQSMDDQERSERLRELGYRILRLENKTVFQFPLMVLDEIERNFLPPQL